MRPCRDNHVIMDKTVATSIASIGNDGRSHLVKQRSLWRRRIAAPCQEPGHRNIFIKLVPMNAVSRQLTFLAMLDQHASVGENQANGIPSVRPSDNSTHILLSSNRIDLAEVLIPRSFNTCFVLLNRFRKLAQGASIKVMVFTHVDHRIQPISLRHHIS